MLFVIIFSIYLASSVEGEDCCKNLKVGGVSYTFKGEENTTPFNCKDSCTYYKTDDPNTKFCFTTSGGLKTECEVAPSSKQPISMSSSVTSKPDKSSVTSSPSPTVTSGIKVGLVGGTKVTWPLKTSPVSQFPKYTTVFGVPVFAASSVSDAQFQHLASVLASWLDNDQDGCVDNPLVAAKLLSSNPKPAVLAPGPGEPSDQAMEAFFTAGYESTAPVYNGELLPACSGPSATSECADASLEEILHMVTAKGFSKVWPDVFGEGPTPTSKLTEAMDVARGGKFLTIPASYPSNAWYTYKDSTCTYACQATEYIYWGVTAWVGALVGRGNEIKNEWKFETRAKLEAGDTLMTAIIKNTTVYKLPNVSPTGTYKGPAVCPGSYNHS